MQRLTQMHVITDLLGTFDPDADLGILVDEGEVEPGSYLKPLQVRRFQLLECEDLD